MPTAAHKDYSGTPLPRKLGIREGSRVLLVSPPPGFTLGPLPPGAELRPHPAWSDLDPAGRLEAYEAARALRRLEAARDPEGLTSTARAVLARLER